MPTLPADIGPGIRMVMVQGLEMKSRHQHRWGDLRTMSPRCVVVVMMTTCMKGIPLQHYDYLGGLASGRITLEALQTSIPKWTASMSY
jgi:hypothetical protein